MNHPRSGAIRRNPRISEQLADAFGDPVCFKLAADGAWETALTRPLHPHSHAAEHRDLDRWCAAAGDDVAVEVGFATGAFAGLRLRPSERKHASELLHALRADLRVTAARAFPSLEVHDVLAALDRAAQPRFAGQSPTRAEVGVLDRWRSLGAVNLGPPPWWNVAAALTRQPGGRALLTAALPGPLMLEVAYGARGDGWLAAPVSRPDPGPGGPIRHYADGDSLDRVARLLNAVDQVTPTIHP